MNYILFMLFLSFIFVGFYFIGGFFKYLLKLNHSLNNILIGSGAAFGLLFLLSFLLVYFQQSFSMLFWILTTVYSVLIVLGLFKTKIKIKPFPILFTIAFIVLFFILSSRITLGEQMGDSVFYFQESSLNIDNPILQSFVQSNGIIYNNVIFYNDSYFTFYFFFSYVIKLLISISKVLNLYIFPSYMYNMWIANGLFFGLTGIIILNIIDMLKVKSKLIKLSLFTFLGLFITTYYFNLSLAHIGNTFIYVFYSFAFLVIYDYFQSYKIGNLFILSLLFYAIVSAANVGVIISFYIAFGLFIVSLINKDKNVFIMLSVLFIPVIHYIFVLAPLDGNLANISFLTNLLNFPIVAFVLILISVLLYKYQITHAFLFKLSYVIMGMIILVLFYLNLKYVPNYYNEILNFSDIKANFDRVQDYFTLSTFQLSFVNITQYFLLISLFFIKETRKIALILLVLIIFFINPLMYPFIYQKILWLYQRAYFVLFNLGTLGLGIVALITHLNNTRKKYYKFGAITLIFISLIYTSINLTQPISPIYVPSENFNPIYKLPQDQVDILEKTRSIIEIEQLDTPRIVSQIYATLFYLEKMDSVAFNTAQRRGLFYSNSYDELSQIFYTPVFAGDDGLRLSAPVEKTCQLLMDARVDFVIYDKDLSVYDKEVGDWIPTYWYARDCYTKTYENDRYILFRFFW